jgi:hypothetical protein
MIVFPVFAGTGGHLCAWIAGCAWLRGAVVEGARNAPFAQELALESLGWTSELLKQSCFVNLSSNFQSSLQVVCFKRLHAWSTCEWCAGSHGLTGESLGPVLRVIWAVR